MGRHGYSSALLLLLTSYRLVPTAPVVRPSTQFTPLDDLSNPFILDPKTQTYSHQYASIYYLRLDKLKETLLEASHAKWAKAAGR